MGEKGGGSFKKERLEVESVSFKSSIERDGGGEGRIKADKRGH